MTAATSAMSGRNTVRGASRSLGELWALTVDVENGSLSQSSGGAVSIADWLFRGGAKTNFTSRYLNEPSIASVMHQQLPSVHFTYCFPDENRDLQNNG